MKILFRSQHNHGRGLKLPRCLAMLLWGILRNVSRIAIKELQICRSGALACVFGAINLWSTIPVHREEFLWGVSTPKSVRPAASEVKPLYRLHLEAGMV